MASKTGKTLSMLLKTYGVVAGGYFCYQTYSQVVDSKSKSEFNDSYWHLAMQNLCNNWEENGKRSLLWSYYLLDLDNVDWNKVSWKNFGFLKEFEEDDLFSVNDETNKENKTEEHDSQTRS